MRTTAQWMDKFVERASLDAGKDDTEAMAGLMSLIEEIQADALDERRLRYELAAIGGILGARIETTPSRVIETARAFGSLAMATETLTTAHVAYVADKNLTHKLTKAIEQCRFELNSPASSDAGRTMALTLLSILEAA